MHVTEDARFALLCLLGLLGTAALARQDEFEPRAAPPAARQAALTPEGNALRDGQPLNLNAASAEELELLPGVGPRLAREIVAERERLGGYRSLVQLDAVRGVGPKMLQKLAAHVRVDVDGGR